MEIKEYDYKIITNDKPNRTRKGSIKRPLRAQSNNIKFQPNDKEIDFHLFIYLDEYLFRKCPT